MFVVTARVAARLSTLETPADVVAVLPLPERRPVSSLLRPATSPKTAALQEGGGESAAATQAATLLVVYVDGVQDPGNVGTLVRAAAAFGASALVTSPGSADLFGPKTVRASMGALFAVPVFPELQLADVVDQLPGRHRLRPRRPRRRAARGRRAEAPGRARGRRGARRPLARRCRRTWTGS